MLLLALILLNLKVSLSKSNLIIGLQRNKINFTEY